MDFEPGQVLLLVDGQRPQQDVVGKVLGGRASRVEWKISVVEGIRRRLAVRIGELARRCLIEDFVLLYVVGGDLNDFLTGLLCGCRAISLNFTHNARMAEIVRLYREQAPEEIDRIIDESCLNIGLTPLLTYFDLRVRYSLGIRRPNLVFLPFRSRSVSRLYFKKSPVRHLTKEFEFGAFKLAFIISFISRR